MRKQIIKRNVSSRNTADITNVSKNISTNLSFKISSINQFHYKAKQRENLHSEVC